MGNISLGWLQKRIFKYYTAPVLVSSGPLYLNINRKRRKPRTFPYSPEKHSYKKPSKGTSNYNALRFTDDYKYARVVSFRSMLSDLSPSEILLKSTIGFNEKVTGNSSGARDLLGVSYQHYTAF